MHVRKAVPASVALVVAAAGLAPALAAPPKPKPKPITASYDLMLAPVPLPLVGEPDIDGANSCTNPDLEGISTDTRVIKPVGAGTLKVDVTGFAGDWDITVLDGKGKVLGIGSGTTTADPSSVGTDLVEKATIKIRRATELRIAVCNFGGGPEASVKYVFTYA